MCVCVCVIDEDVLFSWSSGLLFYSWRRTTKHLITVHFKLKERFPFTFERAELSMDYMEIAHHVESILLFPTWNTHGAILTRRVKCYLIWLFIFIVVVVGRIPASLRCCGQLVSLLLINYEQLHPHVRRVRFNCSVDLTMNNTQKKISNCLHRFCARLLKHRCYCVCTETYSSQIHIQMPNAAYFRRRFIYWNSFVRYSVFI